MGDIVCFVLSRQKLNFFVANDGGDGKRFYNRARISETCGAGVLTLVIEQGASVCLDEAQLQSWGYRVGSGVRTDPAAD